MVEMLELLYYEFISTFCKDEFTLCGYNQTLILFRYIDKM